MFIPKSGSPTFSGVPKILITEEAAKDMWYIVDECSEEVGWMARATMTKEHNILVDKIYLLHQGVHATTTELTEEGLTKLAEELLASPDGTKEWNNVRAWFH